VLAQILKSKTSLLFYNYSEPSLGSDFGMTSSNWKCWRLRCISCCTYALQAMATDIAEAVFTANKLDLKQDSLIRSRGLG
jgi:hypothetical protein